jgi:hypothetical protein
MGKSEDFLKHERERYGKVFVDLTYAVDNVSPFLERGELNRRKYVTKLPVLKKYIDLVESAEREVHKKRGFLSFFNDDKYIDLLNSYKHDNADALNQLENCSKCVHRNCTEDKFDGCLGCRENSRIAYCDHEKINVTFHDNWVLTLNNDRTGDVDRHKVLATLQDVVKDQKYIIIENLRTDEKFVLYYDPGLSEDSYGEISNEEEFDYVVSTYQSVEE